MGYAIHRGGSGCVKFDGFELPIYQDSIEYLFDGKSSTYLRFESIQDYCDIKQIAWNSTKQYKKGDFVVLLNNGNINSYLLFKALSDNTGKNPLENPSIWYDNYRDSTNTYAGTAILRKILIQVEVVLPKIADWETGYSIYFRSAGQTVRDLLVEAGDINKENWQTEGRISGVCGPVVTIFPNKNMSGKKRSIRLSFYNRNDNTEWTAITQIAITGLVGGLEGTVLNKGGGELYGNVYPHQSNVINLGDSSHKWNAVYANNFKGNADTATKATSATKADSATTATTANKATLASAVENSGTASDGAARHVWFSNSTDETKRASSDNLKYTPNTQMLTTNVSGNAGTATKLQTIRKVDGVNFDGSADITHYGTCSTAAATAAKTVTLNGFNLATGAKVAVKFTVTNTAANPTLNVNGTGAKSIKYRGAAISTDALAANRIYEFIYDGTDYVFVGDINTDTNTTYGNMTGATTSAAGKAGLVPAPTAGAATRYLRSDGTWQIPPDTTYSDATQSAHGLMSVTDKKKLDGIAEGANKITVDSAMSSSSTNPVQNKIVQAALNGKSNTNHTHNYAGSSSAGGVANSAAKLSTARNISANDDYIMNFNFDGSGNVSTQLRAYNAIIAVANANNYPYHRFAKLDTLTDSYQDRVTNLLITQDFNGGGWGICRIVLRTNNQSNTLSSASVDWLVRCGLAADSVQIGLYTKDGSTYADAFFKTVGTYWSTTIRNLGSGSRGNIGRTWTFINSSETNNTTTTDKKTSYEVYVSLADAGTALHNQAYTSTITGVDVGTVKYANTSGSATSAEKATKDSTNQQINTTYIKGISANGKTITVTKGDNKTGTATISGFVPMEGTTKDNPMTGAIIQSSTDNGNTYLAGYTPSGSRLITSSSSGTRTTELTPSSFTTNLETGDAETSGALDVTFYPQKNKQMIYLGGSSSDWIIRGVGTPVESDDAVNKNYIDSTLENWSNDLVEELQTLISVYGTWEDTPVTGDIVFNGKATVTGVKEPSSDSDVATKGYVDRQNSIKSVTLTAAGWTGTAAPYTQTVKVDGIMESDNPVMVSMLAAGASPDTQKTYNKAFGIICSGTGTTANGSVTFSVYSKPTTDITVGLKGI